jgi:hypothetical protein
MNKFLLCLLMFPFLLFPDKTKKSKKASCLGAIASCWRSHKEVRLQDRAESAARRGDMVTVKHCLKRNRKNQMRNQTRGRGKKLKPTFNEDKVGEIIEARYEQKERAQHKLINRDLAHLVGAGVFATLSGAEIVTALTLYSTDTIPIAGLAGMIIMAAPSLWQVGVHVYKYGTHSITKGEFSSAENALLSYTASAGPVEVTLTSFPAPQEVREDASKSSEEEANPEELV